MCVNLIKFANNGGLLICGFGNVCCFFGIIHICWLDSISMVVDVCLILIIISLLSWLKKIVMMLKLRNTLMKCFSKNDITISIIACKLLTL